MTELTDEELLAAIAASPGTLPEFYRRHVAKVVGVGVRRFDRPEDVADFVADVFVEVMGSAHRFDPVRGNAVSWLYGLAANIAANRLRRQRRTQDVTRRLSGRALLDSDDYERVEAHIDAVAELRAVYTAMVRLSEADRRLLELVAVDGLAVSDAASALGISPVAARMRLARARARLRASMADDVQHRAARAAAHHDAPVAHVGQGVQEGTA